jgi:hypothetical protein
MNRQVALSHIETFAQQIPPQWRCKDGGEQELSSEHQDRQALALIYRDFLQDRVHFENIFILCAAHALRLGEVRRTPREELIQQIATAILHRQAALSRIEEFAEHIRVIPSSEWHPEDTRRQTFALTYRNFLADRAHLEYTFLLSAAEALHLGAVNRTSREELIQQIDAALLRRQAALSRIEEFAKQITETPRQQEEKMRKLSIAYRHFVQDRFNQEVPFICIAGDALNLGGEHRRCSHEQAIHLVAAAIV